jgi:deoxycytidylate deaminase
MVAGSDDEFFMHLATSLAKHSACDDESWY